MVTININNDKIVVKNINLWTEKSIDYNSTILQQAIRNKRIAEKHKDYDEMNKWDKVITLHEKRR